MNKIVYSTKDPFAKIISGDTQVTKQKSKQDKRSSKGKDKFSRAKNQDIQQR